MGFRGSQKISFPEEDEDAFAFVLAWSDDALSPCCLWEKATDPEMAFAETDASFVQTPRPLCCLLFCVNIGCIAFLPFSIYFSCRTRLQGNKTLLLFSFFFV
jgi:hypothetical protein